MDLDANYLISSLLISCLGGAFFMYGKRAQRPFPLVGGILLGVYPYFVTNLWAMWGIAVVVAVVLYMLRDR